MGVLRIPALLLGLLLTIVTGCGSGGDPSNFIVSADSGNISVMADYTVAVPLHLTAINSFEATIEFTAVAPPGFTCNPSCTVDITANGDQSVPFVFYLDTDSTLPGPVVYPIVFHGVEGKVQHDITVPVTVNAYNGITPPPNFTFTVDPLSTVAAISASGGLRDNTYYTLTFTRFNHYTGPITGQVTLDPYTSCSTNCSFVDSTPVLITPFYIYTQAEPGGHEILFTAQAGSVTRTVTAKIIVEPSPPGLRPGG